MKRPLIRENLNVIQSTSPRRLMPHLLHQMVQNRTNLGGHSIQMIIIINQATTKYQTANHMGSNTGSEYCDSGGISTGPVPQARLGVERQPYSASSGTKSGSSSVKSKSGVSTNVLSKSNHTHGGGGGYNRIICIGKSRIRLRFNLRKTTFYAGVYFKENLYENQFQ